MLTYTKINDILLEENTALSDYWTCVNVKEGRNKAIVTYDELKVEIIKETAIYTKDGLNKLLKNVDESDEYINYYLLPLEIEEHKVSSSGLYNEVLEISEVYFEEPKIKSIVLQPDLSPMVGCWVVKIEKDESQHLLLWNPATKKHAVCKNYKVHL